MHGFKIIAFKLMTGLYKTLLVLLLLKFEQVLLLSKIGDKTVNTFLFDFQIFGPHENN